MMNITLKQLKYFEALAEHKHFGRAANASAISQPALSMQIKDLETELEAPLFERNAKEIQLTAFGETFSHRAKEILRSVDELEDFVQASKKGSIGRIRIGIIPTIAPYLLPSIIANLTHVNPEIEIHIRETMTQKLVEELKQGKLDTAILALPISDPAFVEVPLMDEEFLLVRPKADETKPIPNSETLSQMRLLLLEEGHCFREQAISFCNMQSNLPRESLDGSSLSTLVQMVSSGIGVTLIPEMAVDVETRSANVCVAGFEKSKPTRTIGMIWRKTSPLSDRFLEISEIVKQATISKKPRS